MSQHTDQNAIEGGAFENLPSFVKKEVEGALDRKIICALSNWLYLLIMVIGFAVGAYIWAKLEKVTISNAQEFAGTVTAIWIDTNFGFSLVLALFVWIFAATLVLSLIIRLIPMPAKASLFFGASKELGKVVADFTRQWSEENSVSKPQDTGDAINRSLDAYIRRNLLRLSPFIGIIILLCWSETRSFEVITENGLYDSSMFSRNVAFKPWSEAKEVSLGCNQTDDGGSLIYRVEFNDGTKIRLPESSSLNGRHWLVNLEHIDKALSTQGAVFKRWSWLERDALHPKCLRGFYAEVGPDNKYRIDDLLRIGFFPEDERPSLTE